MADDLPWLAPAWQRLIAYTANDRLPQALLVTGKPGLGKMRLALAFAQRLLCRSPSDEACGICASCLLFQAQTHPDLQRVEPIEAGKPIIVDQIRGLIEKLALAPQYGGKRVVIIAPAQSMNISAANSLLKTLEEPDAHTLMLLLSDDPHSLPATILSRCQRLNIVPPTRDLALAWLSRKGVAQADALLTLAQGAPLRALALAGEDAIERRSGFFSAWQAVGAKRQDPLSVADRWQPSSTKTPPVSCESLTEWMLSWTQDLIRLRAASAQADLDNPDLRPGLQALSEKLDLKAIYAFLDRLLAARQMLTGQVNRPLLLEELLILWSRLQRH
ncbi:DNA polymerase III subunit delta' [Methylococcus sp. EFPC2]|nr:DNA polymerase III subunit delta' [Methylococcus sp. EFPC2]